MVNMPQGKSRPSIGPGSLAAAVRYHRKKSGLTQVQLAQLAGVGKTVVFDVEKGKKSIRFDTLNKILKILNITPGFSSPLMEVFLKEKNEKR